MVALSEFVVAADAALSYASSWPDPPTLFVEVNYHVATAGEIGEQVDGSSGAVIDCRDAVLIELLHPAP